MLLLGGCFLVAAIIVAALAATVTSRLGIKGRPRLLSISLAVATAVSPVLSGAGHGGIPLPFIVALGEAVFSLRAPTPTAGLLSGVGTVYVMGVALLAPFIALVLHLVFRRWAYDRL